MAIVNIEIDAACASSADVAAFVSGGTITEVVAILNRRWEDTSAINLVKEAGLWRAKRIVVEDDTPGTLVLTVDYPWFSPAVLEHRFNKHHAIVSYEVNNPLWLQICG